MKKILFAAMVAVILAAVSGAWAEEKEGAEEEYLVNISGQLKQVLR